MTQERKELNRTSKVLRYLLMAQISPYLYHIALLNSAIEDYNEACTVFRRSVGQPVLYWRKGRLLTEYTGLDRRDT